MAGKRVGSAVARNRAKRLLREAAHARYPHLAPGWDLVLVARAPLAKVRLAEAQMAVDNLFHRARVLTDDV